MRKLLGVVVVVVGVLAAVLVAKTLGQKSLPRVTEHPAPNDALSETAIAEHLAAAVRFRTVSHEDPKDDDRGAFAELRKFLTTTYQRVHVGMVHETINGDGLLYRWPGTDPNAAPILFLAHQDVVPIEPGTEGKWTHPPFDGAIADGFVWGRGALDDKCSLIALFEAFESLLAEGWTPARTIWFASGFDEEVGGRQGAKKIGEELRARGVKFAWVLDEGTMIFQGLMPEVERPVATVAISEKGYLSLELTTHAPGGHSSLPPHDMAIGILASAIDRLQKNPLPARLTPAFEKALELLAPEMPFGSRLALSNLWLTSPLVLRKMTDRPETNAQVRTTTAPTIVQAGVKDNVLPSTARAVVNFRILPGESMASVMGHVQKVIADDRITVAKLERSLSEPAALANTDGGGYEVIRAAVRELYPDAVIVPGVMNGATDSRHVQGLTSDIYRFLPTVITKSDLPRIHGTDERISVSDLATMVRTYRRIIQRGGAALPPPAP